MAEVLKCFIEVEDEWIQEGCHWKTDRVIIFTYKIPNTYSGSSKSFYYRLSESDSFTLIRNSEVKQLNSTTYYYELKLSSLLADDSLLSKLNNDNNLKIGSKIEINDGTTSAEESASFAYYYYTFPPKSENLQVTLDRKSADCIICSWQKPDEIENNPSVAGYCIELFCKKKDNNTFVQYKSLGWAVYPADYKDEALRGHFVTDSEARRKLTKVISATDPTIDKVQGEMSFKGLGSSYELYTNGPHEVSFYFRPRDFDIQKDDFFMIKVYPYIVYGSYINGNEVIPGSLLASESDIGANSSEEMKFTLGTVKVKTADAWVEGQVWVCVADETSPTGVKWKEADSIYTLTSDGWKESIS